MNFDEKIELGKKLTAINIDKALVLFEKLKANFSDKKEVLFELGKIYYIKQNYLQAKKNLELIKKQGNDYHLNLLLSKIYKALNQGFSALKILLKLYKSSKNKEVEKEIVNLFLIKKQDLLAIKFLLKNNRSNTDLNSIIKFQITNISKEVANDNFYKVKKEIKKLMNIFKKNTEKNEYLREKNILLNEYEIGTNQIILKSKPRNLTVTLTNKCNLKCRMCYVWNHKYEINNKVIKNIISLFPYIETIVWIGGEVFLYKNIDKLLILANKYNLRQSISTNGLLLTENIIKKFVSYNLDLTISIDSVNKVTYENIRQGAKFEDLIKIFKLIKKYSINSKLNLAINIVLSKWNLNENFYNFIPFAKKYNISKITYSMDVTEENNNKIIDNFNTKYRKRILDTGIKENIKIVITIPQHQVQINKKNDYDSIKKYDRCLRPWKSLFIDIDEYIRPDCYCNSISRIDKTKNILYLWNSKNFVNFRKKMLKQGTNICKNICKNNSLDFQRFKM